MNKAYRQVYKDGIGWVAIAENASCVSSSKGSGTVVEKSGVEILKNFFDLRNSVVLNNGFLLKGLFAATLFCGVFVGDLKAISDQDIADIQNNGTTVYTDNDGNRMEKVVNSNGIIGFKGTFVESMLDKAINGIVEINGRYYVVPTGTLNKVMSPNELKQNPILFEVKKDGTRPTGYRGLTFKELEQQGKKVGYTGSNGDRESVVYDKTTKLWYVQNQQDGEKLYPAVWTTDSSRKIRYVKWSEIILKNGEPILDSITGLYITSGSGANEVGNLGIKKGGDIFSDSPERLSLVGKDSISTTPQKYTQADKTNGKIPAGRDVGENKDGNIRLGNVAKALQDDEAVNLGQLNERLEKIPYASINSSKKGPGSNYNSDGATGQDAIAIGVNAKASTVSTIAIGRNAGQSEYIGNSIFIGDGSGQNSKKYDNSENNWGSVVIGQQSGINSTGDANLYIGSTTGASHTGSQNIFLGDTAKVVKYNNKDKGEPERLLNKSTSGNRNIYIGNQYVHSTVPKGEINDSIAIGTLSNASNSKSIAIGSSSSNKKYGALSIGKTSIAIGSSTTDDNNGSTARGDNSISFGSDTLAIENDSVALGAFSVADRKALSDAEKQKVYLAKNTDVANTVKNTKGAISIGKSGENGFTRQITNVAAGTENTDAVNVAQLKAGLSGKADLNAGNLSDKTGSNPDNTNETYADVWKTALGISDTNIKNLAQDAVVVANGENTTVAKDTSATGDITYKVNVKLDEYAKSADIDTKLGNYVKSVTGDKFINVDGTTQNPALSLNTTELAKDNKLITSIVNNETLKKTYVTNENLEKGYTKLDGTNLFKDNTLNELNPNFKKDNWRKALDISDANIQKLAQKSVVVANGENTTVAKDTSATGDITYKVNVKLDEYAKSADIDTKLGNYVKSVTGDKFINVDGTTQNPALSLNTTELAKDNKLITSIVNNETLKKTYVTNEKLADSGLKFTGDDTTKTIDKKLGGTISIKGGADSAKLSDSNIGVVAVNNSLQVKLAKNLLGLESAEFKKGADTTTVSAEEGVSTTKTLKVTDSNGKTVAKIDNTQIKDADGKAVTNINSAINNLYTTTKGLTIDNALAVKYDSADKKEITLGGIGATDKVAIKNLASAGDINDAKNEFNAVNAGDLKTALNGVSSSITNKIDIGDFTSLSVTANGGSAKDEIKANENIDFTAKDGIKVAYDKNVNKFTFSADINSIAGNIADNNAFSTKYAMLDGSNLIATKGFKQDAWREALGLKNSDIANIFKGKNGISIDKDGNKYTISYKGTGGGTGTGGISEAEVEKIIREYIGNNNMGSSDGSSDNIVTHDVKERKTTNNKNIIAAINKINQEGIGFVHVNGGKIDPDPTTGISANDSSAEGTNAIAIGPKSKAKGNNSISIGLESQASGGENAIAIGTGSQANGYKSIAIGVGNVVTGQNSGAFGDPSIVAGIDSYSVGNNNEINSNDTFVLGNKVRVGADMQGAVVLGSGSTAVDKATQESRATVNGITYDGFKGQAASDGMILSVGAKNAERQIKNVAAGEISADSTDAVNGSQLYATNNIIGNVANSVKNVIGGNVKVNNNGEISASNIGGTDQPTINDAIASINNKINSGGKSYIAIDVPTNGGGVPIASKGSNSIAIGAGSSDDKRKNVVSVGNATKGLNRTITNVAPGKYGTDAVNMNQLYGVAGGLSKQINDVKKKSSAGIAGAVALGMLPQSNIPGDALVSIGTGYHDSESAVALGISKTSDNARWIFKGGVSYDSQDEVTAGASVGFHF